MVLIPVILAGGGGKRLFPLSTKENPKYFLRVNSDSSLLEETIERASFVLQEVDRRKLERKEKSGYKKNITPEIILVVNESQSPRIKRFLRGEGLRVKILEEPMMKNTAPAICYCARYIMEKYGDAIMLVMPSDHKIQGKSSFLKAVKKGYITAQKGLIATFGIVPTYPETGYGYIKVDRKQKITKGVFKVEKFTEKPDRKTAEKYVKSGNYYWNSGIFMFRASLILDELRRFTKIVDIFERYEDIRRVYDSVPEISIDYAVCEKSDKIACISSNFRWSDIGSFKSMWELYRKDKGENAGDGIFFEAERCFVISSDRGKENEKGKAKSEKKKKVIIFGLKDVVFAEGEKYILVAPMWRSQEVKKIAEFIEAKEMKNKINKKTERKKQKNQ